jgi:predicted nucleic acid-binding protein
MSRFVFLDSGPLGLLTNPRPSQAVIDCLQWLQDLLTVGVNVVIPEIVDYELRRELLLGNKQRGLRRLQSLHDTLNYMPLDTLVMRRAAELWAATRKRGLVLADPKAIDVDVILAAQALGVAEAGHNVTVATTNVKHLSLLVQAEEWDKIVP